VILSKAGKEQVFKALSKDLHACIETQNLEEARLVISRAEEAFESNDINQTHIGELVWDFINFEDELVYNESSGATATARAIQ
jgi:hypothetical protein